MGLLGRDKPCKVSPLGPQYCTALDAEWLSQTTRSARTALRSLLSASDDLIPRHCDAAKEEGKREREKAEPLLVTAEDLCSALLCMGACHPNLRRTLGTAWKVAQPCPGS